MTDPPGAAWRSSSPPRPTATEALRGEIEEFFGGGRPQDGSALSVLDFDDDHLPEIIVGADKAENLDAALWAYRSRADSDFSQQAEHATGLGDPAPTTADPPMYIGRQLRAAARRVTVGSP
jgi:hypothetical protein